MYFTEQYVWPSLVKLIKFNITNQCIERNNFYPRKNNKPQFTLSKSTLAFMT